MQNASDPGFGALGIFLAVVTCSICASVCCCGFSVVVVAESSAAGVVVAVVGAGNDREHGLACVDAIAAGATGPSMAKEGADLAALTPPTIPVTSPAAPDAKAAVAPPTATPAVVSTAPVLNVRSFQLTS